MPLLKPDDKKQVHAARRLCELFKGRFSEEIAKRLIDDLGGELEAVDFVLNEESSVVSTYLKENTDYVENIRSDSKKIANLLENGIEYEERQFACKSCVRSWWKKVPFRKQVAKCFRCKTKYDPVPQDKEWGWAKFVCPCSNEFHAYGEMGLTESECYKCKMLVPVKKVLPPRRRIGAQRKSDKPHSCNGVNCFNRHDDGINGGMAVNMMSYNSTHASHHNDITYNMKIDATGQGNKKQNGTWNTVGRNGKATGSKGQQQGSCRQNEQPVCIHPESLARHRRIRTPSKKHVSTGSTVNTFLSQGSLDTASIVTMGTIHEHRCTSCLN